MYRLLQLHVHTDVGALGLALHWLNSTMMETGLVQIFAVIPTTVSERKTQSGASHKSKRVYLARKPSIYRDAHCARPGR